MNGRMRVFSVALSALLGACPATFEVGAPPCIEDSDCSKEVLGSDFASGLVCVEDRCVPAGAPDSGPVVPPGDTGVPPADTGAPPPQDAGFDDAGNPVIPDSGPAADSGQPPGDSGPPPSDAGSTPPSDGPAPESDAGEEQPDVGQNNNEDGGGEPGLDGGDGQDVGLDLPDVGPTDGGDGDSGIVEELTEVEYPNGCSDGEDNDNNGDIDCDDGSCGDDENCRPPQEGDNDNECADGEDNDNDGDVDCADDGCLGSQHCQSELCDDGEDNDGDNAIDCDDDDCADHDDCQAPAPTLCDLRTSGYFNTCGDCHVQGHQSMLVIDNTSNETLYETIVNGQGATFFPLVSPGFLGGSYLWNKLNGTQADFGEPCGQDEGCIAMRGEQMPANNPPLNADALADVQAWLQRQDVGACIQGGGGNEDREQCGNGIDDDGDDDVDCLDADCAFDPMCNAPSICDLHQMGAFGSCSNCHMGENPSGGLRIDNTSARTLHDTLTQGTGNSGISAVVQGNHQQSYVYHKLGGTQDEIQGGGLNRMPLDGPYLDGPQLGGVAGWINRENLAACLD
jgi:hypothetical protein